jgi:hypothetical protein
MATEITETDIEILTEDHAQPELDLVAADAPAKKPEILDPEVGLEKLKKQLADGERERQAAEARARAAETEAAAARQAEVAARTEAQSSNLNTVTTAIAALNQAMDAGEAAYAEALATGDHARAAKINREMNTNAAKLQKLEDGKMALEQAPKPAPRPAPVAADPVERLASQLSPRSAAWVRSHPEYASGSKYQKMIAAHQLALADGAAADSDAYFDSIEDTLKLRQAAPLATDPEPDVTPQRATGGRSTAPAAAPVSRSGQGNGSSKPTTMRLTREMREMASAMGMTDQEYAKYRQQLIDEGQIH